MNYLKIFVDNVTSGTRRRRSSKREPYGSPGTFEENEGLESITDRHLSLDFVSMHTIPIEKLSLIPRSTWSEITFEPGNNDLIIGQGSFGIVIKALWSKTPLTSHKSISSSGHDTPRSRKNTLLSRSIFGSKSSNHSSPSGKSVENSDKNLSIISTPTPAPISAVECVVKISISSLDDRSSITSQSKDLELALQEVIVIQEAESKIIYKDCIIKVYGVCFGKIPNHLMENIGKSGNEINNAVGIIMRYEGGGTLSSYIYSKVDPLPAIIETSTSTVTTSFSESSSACTTVSPEKLLSNKKIPYIEKIRLLSGIARGLAELHSVGIVHGDIKPDNVLLSSDQPCQIRLADFGLSAIKESKPDMGNTTLRTTMGTKGTPMYCAPEMLVNVLAENEQDLTDSVAKASRKTDMYAFAILMWEVLCQEKPFKHVLFEVHLCHRVHSGERPTLKQLPVETSKIIKNLMISCWDRNRKNRKSALECFSILSHHYELLHEKQQISNKSLAYDAYIIHDNSNIYEQDIANLIFHRLTQLGYKVCNQHLSSNESSQTLNENDVLDTPTLTSQTVETSVTVATGQIVETSATGVTDIHIPAASSTATAAADTEEIMLNIQNDLTHVFIDTDTDTATASVNHTATVDNNIRSTTETTTDTDIMNTSLLPPSFISKSKIIVACLSRQQHMNNPQSMHELTEAVNRGKIIIPVFLDNNYTEWTDKSVIDACQTKLNRSPRLDLSHLTPDDFVSDDGPSETTRQQVYNVVEQIVKELE